MSRVPPLPSNRYPSNASYDSSQSGSPSIRPLQISRPSSRPTTPGSNSIPLPGSSRGSSSNPNGPSRPQRSGLRSRHVSEYSNSDSVSFDGSSNRDSRDRADSLGTTIRTNFSVPQGTRNNVAGPSKSSPSNGRPRPSRAPISPTSPGTEPEMSPTSIAAIAAFQRAGRMRGMTLEDEEYEREKEKEIAIQKDRQKRIRDKVPGRRTTGKHRPGDIDAVLDEIKDEWEIVTDPDFNPVDLALQLLDESSLGKDIDSFRRTKDMLSKALKGSVDKHYEAFAAALPHHASLLSHLGVTSKSISEARTALQESKEALSNKRTDLVQLWSRNQTVEEMLRILDQIDHLRTVPDVLESLISEKRLLQAAALLVRSLKLINKQDMLDIGALADLRSYLSSQETALREILVDELHSHLYLRSFWCDSRWAEYTPNQQSLPLVGFEQEPNSIESVDMQASYDSSPTTATPRRSRLDKYLDDLNLRPNDPPYDLDEASFRNSTTGATLSTSSSTPFGLPSLSSYNSLSPILASDQNPEADSFTYIETLLESLAILGKLGSALDIVAQKLPQEIYSLVDSTIEEVAERAEYGKRGSVVTSMLSGPLAGRLEDVFLLASLGTPGALGSGVISVAAGSSVSSANSLRLASLEASSKPIDQEIMKDLFWTLYSKLAAVLQGLRVVYEVANRIGSRRDFKDSSGAKPGSLFPLAEIWMPVQAEVRTLLNDYITDEEQGSVSGRNPISSINEVLREGRYIRDKTKVLREHENELTQALKDTVPGLVQGSTDSTVQATLSALGTDDRMLGVGQHHRLLVHPDAFHVSILFQPTLAFMERISDVLPSGHEASRATTVVLDEFVAKVYLPQLEDKVSLLFHQAVTGPDAFQPDPASMRLSNQPLIKASVQLMALINSLCAMLRKMPFHRENYSRLVLTVIVQFYQRCSDRFQDLVSLKDPEDPEAAPRVALSAQWAQRSELVPILSELQKQINDGSSPAKLQHLSQQETNLEANLLGDRLLGREELIASTRDLGALASLHHSVTWFAAELNALKSAPETALSPTTPMRLEPVSAVTPFTPYRPSLFPVQPDEQLKLPLSAAMAMRFQALHKTYEQLSEVILHTIRVDIRCRVIHHLDLAVRQGNYCIDVEALEPDPYITDLNAELSKCDDFASTTLPEADRQFVFEGIGHLMEQLLITNARYIRTANDLGVRKMMRNILALRQNIKTITDASQSNAFERVKRYYSLFILSPQDLLDVIRQKQEFSFDEYKTLLDLQCGVDPTAGEYAGAQAVDRNYNMYLIELHGLELENSADDE
ncbi:unnamed protein product [Somion occarium]|uniref:Exocyst complex component Sec8 n=1 Tax=Somion occarium TaxID=3059160 RepID=A0ABP1CHE7_9APHY